jgi:hypothetical protein
MPTVAKCLAIASDVNDLPSDGPALVTNSVLGRPLGRRIGARRKASDRLPIAPNADPKLRSDRISSSDLGNNAECCKSGDPLCFQVT